MGQQVHEDEGRCKRFTYRPVRARDSPQHERYHVRDGVYARQMLYATPRVRDLVGHDTEAHPRPNAVFFVYFPGFLSKSSVVACVQFVDI